MRKIPLFLALISAISNMGANPIPLPAHFVIPPRTISPDGRYGVTIADSMDNIGQSQIIEMHTGRLVATIDGPSGWEKKDHSMPWGQMEAVWSRDSSELCWIYPDKWSSLSYVVLKLKNGKPEWQHQVMFQAQKEILTRTEQAAPLNFAATKLQNEEWGSAYAEGFTIDVSEPPKDFKLPLTCNVSLTSDPKGSDEEPDENGVIAWLTMTIAADGSVTYSNFRVKRGEVTPDMKKRVKESESNYPLIDTDMGKAFPFIGTQSIDGHYGLGWTIRPAEKGYGPLDWSHYDPTDPDKLLRLYDWQNYGELDELAKPYEAVDFVLDLRTGATAELPTQVPYWPWKKDGWQLNAAWCPGSNGVQYGLITNNEGDIGTQNFWFITAGKKEIQVQDIAAPMLKAVNHILHDRRPEIPDLRDFLVTYEISPHAKTDKGGLIGIPFTAAVGDSSLKEFGLDGIVTLRPSDGAVTGASSDAKRLDPFSTNSALRDADAELNRVYESALKSLSVKQAEQLKKKQRDWITQRDQDATQAVNVTPYGSSLEAFEQARESSLLESTNKRINEIEHGTP